MNFNQQVIIEIQRNTLIYAKAIEINLDSFFFTITSTPFHILSSSLIINL